MPLFFFVFKLVDTSFFASESVLIIFNKPELNDTGSAVTMNIKQHTYILVLVSYAIMVGFIAINAFSTKAAKSIS
jgi:hypothetical protein